jgi:hypothetical protein
MKNKHDIRERLIGIKAYATGIQRLRALPGTPCINPFDITCFLI